MRSRRAGSVPSDNSFLLSSAQRRLSYSQHLRADLRLGQQHWSLLVLSAHRALGSQHRCQRPCLPDVTFQHGQEYRNSTGIPGAAAAGDIHSQRQPLDIIAAWTRILSPTTVLDIRAFFGRFTSYLTSPTLTCRAAYNRVESGDDGLRACPHQHVGCCARAFSSTSSPICSATGRICIPGRPITNGTWLRGSP